MTTTNESPGGIRASDHDRERVAGILRAATAEGLLTLAEADERLAAAYGARYRHELDPLTADLPDGGRPLYAASPEGAAQRGEFHIWARTRLVWHAAAVAVIAGAAITGWALSGTTHFFPTPILIIGGLSLLLHARRIGWFGRGAWSGPGWHGGGWSGPGWGRPGGYRPGGAGGPGLSRDGRGRPGRGHALHPREPATCELSTT